MAALRTGATTSDSDSAAAVQRRRWAILTVLVVSLVSSRWTTRC